MAGMRCIANTGPLISAFQSESEALLAAFAERIYVPSGALLEYRRHAALELLRGLEAAGLVEVVSLNRTEAEAAANFAGRLAAESGGRPEPAQHLGEAEALALAVGARLPADVVVVDERPARALARELGIPVVGFPGILVRLARSGRIEAAEVRSRLLACQRLGTRYSDPLIAEAYRLAASEDASR